MLFWSCQNDQNIPLPNFHPLWYEREKLTGQRATVLLTKLNNWRWPADGSTVTTCTAFTSPLFCRRLTANPHTEHACMHIELNDLLGRPEQWCSRSSSTVSSLLSHNCTDRIGSEMSVGLKIGLLFEEALQQYKELTQRQSSYEFAKRSHFHGAFFSWNTDSPITGSTQRWSVGLILDRQRCYGLSEQVHASFAAAMRQMSF